MKYDVTEYSQVPYNAGVKIECIQCREIMATKNHSINFASETDTLHIELTLVCYTCMIEYTDISGKDPVWHFMRCERCKDPIKQMAGLWSSVSIDIPQDGHQEN